MISVCMATYNGEKFIKQQIDSILPQLSDEDELIISDDGSKDETINIITAYSEPKIKLFHNTGTHGVIPNFENALRQCQGDYIFLADQDDIWHSDKVKICVAELQNGNALVLSDAIVIDENNNTISSSFFVERNSKMGFWHNFIKSSYMGCVMAFRRELIKIFLPFPKYIAMHDLWIGYIVELAKLPHCFLDQKLHYYRRHGNNVTGVVVLSIWSKIYYRLRTLACVCARLPSVYKYLQDAKK